MRAVLPFRQTWRRRFDTIEIRRVWRFARSLKLLEEVR
jgi:hypothetical protein